MLRTEVAPSQRMLALCCWDQRLLTWQTLRDPVIAQVGGTLCQIPYASREPTFAILTIWSWSCDHVHPQRLRWDLHAQLSHKHTRYCSDQAPSSHPQLWVRLSFSRRTFGPNPSVTKFLVQILLIIPWTNALCSTSSSSPQRTPPEARWQKWAQACLQLATLETEGIGQPTESFWISGRKILRFEESASDQHFKWELELLLSSTAVNSEWRSSCIRCSSLKRWTPTLQVIHRTLPVAEEFVQQLFHSHLDQCSHTL